MLETVLNLFYPPKCIFCGRVLDMRDKLEVCRDCFEKIPRSNYKDFVYDLPECYFNEVICACNYSGIVREAILRYKFFNKPSYHKTFAKILLKEIMKTQVCIDSIISLPLHKQRQYLRGYNQSYLISRYLSKKLRIPEVSKNLKRIKDTKTQSLLPREERFLNVKDAFKVLDSNGIAGKSILLVDDILTTGASVNECSRVLKEIGAEKITVCVIAQKFF